MFSSGRQNKLDFYKGPVWCGSRSGSAGQLLRQSFRGEAAPPGAWERRACGFACEKLEQAEPKKKKHLWLRPRSRQPEPSKRALNEPDKFFVDFLPHWPPVKISEGLVERVEWWMTFLAEVIFISTHKDFQSTTD
jgi:hypothetical protein